MKTTFPRLLVALALMAGIHRAAAQGTAFTYQGQLQNNSSSVSGNYDFTFALFNSSSTNSGQVGSTLTNLDVGVTNGLFTAMLDFGSNFPGANRWLAIGVRTNGSGSFTALNPLQEVTPTPYAIYAPNAGSALTATTAGSASNATSAATATTAGNFTGSLSGNVTGTQSSTVVSSVGGQTAANIASGVIAANGATSGNTPGAIVARDGSGNFSAGSVSLSGVLNLPFPAIIMSGTNTLLIDEGSFFAGLAGVGWHAAAGAGDVGVGDAVLGSGDSGGGNTAIGEYALHYNTLGSDNTASGSAALLYNVSGSYNMADGFEALHQNYDGSYNTANGYEALYSNDHGSYNTANGYQALYYNTEGICDTATGSGALYSSGAYLGGGNGSYNTADGFNALYANASGNANTANGYQALGNNGEGSYNTANGANALYNNIDGNNNTANGYQALYYNTGNANTANGYEALFNNTDGTANTANGVNALLNNNGSYNTAAGVDALESNLTGYDNTADGVEALVNNTTGSENTANGVNALQNNNGSGNIGIGFNAGANLTTGNNNIDIGNNGLAGESGLIRIGTVGVQTACYLAGTVYANGTFVSSSDRNAKENFKAVNAREVLEKVAAMPVSRWNYKQNDPSAHIGPMAQDFYAAFDIGPDDKHITTIDESGVALAAIQGLNQKLEETQQAVKAKDGEIQNLAKKISELQAIVNQLATQK